MIRRRAQEAEEKRLRCEGGWREEGMQPPGSFRCSLVAGVRSHVLWQPVGLASATSCWEPGLAGETLSDVDVRPLGR